MNAESVNRRMESHYQPGGLLMGVRPESLSKEALIGAVSMYARLLEAKERELTAAEIRHINELANIAKRRRRWLPW